jgi:hypothetical protein
MKKLLAALAAIVLFLAAENTTAQIGPPAPGNGIYALIDTNYRLGTATEGQTQVKITLKNTTANLYTAVQFRLFYDKTAFSSASVSLIGPPANLDIQTLNNAANGFVTVTLVYTGNNPTYTLSDGERFLVTLTHVPSATFFSLPSISPITWTGAQAYSQVATSQAGLDIPLTLHSYGGSWIVPRFAFRGTFTNVTGTPSKYLTLALEKSVKNSGSWNTHNAYVTDQSGAFSLSETIDTTYYDVRLNVKGDTMIVGNVISTADAQLINQWAIGGINPQMWDFYTGDVNGSNDLTISDAYGVFGRITGRFTSWPNSVKDIKFFTASQYATITAEPSTNYTSTIPGATNFVYNILPGTPDSVRYYVLVPGDANGTGYRMARLTPIVISPNPDPNYPSQIENVIDMNVEYDFPTNSMEVNFPSLKVNEGSMVEIPVTVKTFGQNISALQVGMLYDQDLLEYKELQNSPKTMFWMSSLNPADGIVEWSGYDPSGNKSYMIPDNYKVFTLKFIAKKPLGEWETSPLSTTHKFSGDNSSKDMNIYPTNGILVVARIGFDAPVTTEMMIYPNPVTGDFYVNFNVKESGPVKISIMDLTGRVQHVVIDHEMPSGKYTYMSNIDNLRSGLYVAMLQSTNQLEGLKIIKTKNN